MTHQWVWGYVGGWEWRWGCTWSFKPLCALTMVPRYQPLSALNPKHCRAVLHLGLKFLHHAGMELGRWNTQGEDERGEQ